MQRKNHYVTIHKKYFLICEPRINRIPNTQPSLKTAFRFSCHLRIFQNSFGTQNRHGKDSGMHLTLEKYLCLRAQFIIQENQDRVSCSISVMILNLKLSPPDNFHFLPICNPLNVWLEAWLCASKRALLTQEEHQVLARRSAHSKTSLSSMFCCHGLTKSMAQQSEQQPSH